MVTRPAPHLPASYAQFSDGDTIVIEPFRAKAFPGLKDLVVDRNAFDRIIQSGGYVSIRTGSAPDAHSVQVNKADADLAFDAAACIGCGACVASCPNASAMLFTGAKLSHLGRLPQGQAERYERVDLMVTQMDSKTLDTAPILVNVLLPVRKASVWT